MNIEVKKCADKKDVKGLKYIFVDCLDVDPTFKRYKEEFEYCKDISGFLEDYIELTPLQNNPISWNEDYWVKLKVDLLKNFSVKRFYHMIEVAKVVKRDKIKSLEKEREHKTESIVVSTHENDAKTVIPEKNVHEKSVDKEKSIDITNQEREIQEAKLQLELENKRIQAEIDRKNKEREERRKQLNSPKKDMKSMKDEVLSPKKAMGIVLLAILIVLIIVLIVVNLKGNPRIVKRVEQIVTQEQIKGL